MNPRRLYVQPGLLQTLPDLPLDPSAPGSCPEHSGESVRYCRACIADVKCGDRYLKYLGQIQPRCDRDDCSNAVDAAGGQITCWDCTGSTRRRHLRLVPDLQRNAG